MDEKELEAIASRPLSTYMFKIGSFDALDSIKSELALSTCKGMCTEYSNFCAEIHDV